MTKNKLKILMVSEASFLSSGFGTYAREVLSRLHNTGKYEIAELASYGLVNDPRDKDIIWTYYANAVRENDPRHKEYSSRSDNQFGKWRFEKVLLDYRPDVVVDIRDYWMSSYQASSPLRPYFHWCLMPTVDSEPQQEEWIDTFLGADAIFTYSDWGADVLKRQSSGKIKYISTASPGVDLSVFKIQDKKEAKKTLGIPEDSIIIGSVMRNQKRKLLPELCLSFKKVLTELQNSNPDLGKKMYLYLHTSYPDMGWDLPELLKDNGIANKVLFTSICKQCKYIHATTFAGPLKICPKCFTRASSFPSVTDGVSTKDLSTIYNTFNLYVQYAICEGFGMPQVEAGACGIQIATVGYSAMIDVINKIGAKSISVKSYFKELETKAIRAYPDNDELVQYILEQIKIPEHILEKNRLETRKLTELHYNWDNTAKKWEEYFDLLDNRGFRSDWDKAANIMDSRIESPKDSDPSKNFENVVYLCGKKLLNLSAIGSEKFLSMLKDSDYGYSQVSPTQITQYSYSRITDYLRQYIENNNQAEQIRSNKTEFQDDFIYYSKMKNQS